MSIGSPGAGASGAAVSSSLRRRRGQSPPLSSSGLPSSRSALDLDLGLIVSHFVGRGGEDWRSSQTRQPARAFLKGCAGARRRRRAPTAVAGGTTSAFDVPRGVTAAARRGGAEDGRTDDEHSEHEQLSTRSGRS